MQNRINQLSKASCSIFKEIQLNGRSGKRILNESMEGPPLKSFWPNKLTDLVNWNKRTVSSEIPINSKICLYYLRDLNVYQSCLPVTLHNVYRENISEWRRKRGGQAKKGNYQSLITNIMYKFL